MKNSLIEEFAEKTFRETSESPQVTRQVRESIESGLVPWDNLPTRGEIAVIPHLPSANYTPGQALHSHDYFELIYVYAGSAVQYLETDRLPLDKGSLLLMNMYSRHGLLAESDSIVFNIVISRDLLNTSFLNLIRDNSSLTDFFVESLFSSSQEGAYIYFQKNPDSLAEHLMQLLLEEYILQSPGFQSAMQSYLSLIFTELYRNHLYESDRDSGGNIHYADIMAYMNSHLENITLGSLAEHFHYRRLSAARSLSGRTRSWSKPRRGSP